MSFYAQDTFQISPRFTLNFGVRWEPTFPDPDKYGRGTSFSLAGFDAGQFSSVYPNAPAGLFFKGDPGIPDAMWNGQMANFAPRLGLVWNPHGDGRDTLRVSAAAILYDVTETWFNERETTNAPIGTNIDTPNPVGGLSNPWQGYPGGNPFPQNGKAFFPTAGVYVNMPLNPKPTYVANWNITYQRQLPAAGWLSVSYLGNKTTHLWSGNGEINPAVYIPGNCVAGQYGLTATGLCSTTSNTNHRRVLYLANPALGAAYASINTADDGAVAHYNGVLVSLQHRFAHNFTFLANYTDSYCISDTDFGAALATPGNSQPFNRHADWGPCVFDTRHNFNMSLGGHQCPEERQPVGESAAERLANGAACSRLKRPALERHRRQGQLAHRLLNNDRPNQMLADYPATNTVCNNGTTPCVQFAQSGGICPECAWHVRQSRT